MHDKIIIDASTYRRIMSVVKKFEGIPVDLTTGGRRRSWGSSTLSSGSTMGALTISGLHADSPVTGIRIYTGTFYGKGYGDGTSSYVTDEDITIKIPGIGSNVTLPSYGLWSHLPPCLGLKTKQTWTGATETHTNDTVYEAYQMALFL